MDTPTRETRSETAEEEVQSDLPEVSIRVRTATMTSADSSSIHTLTDRDAAAIATDPQAIAKEQRFSPNPAGAASAPRTSSHIRHTTCSSVESEGFHSTNGEEISLEDMVHQDWSQWSKQVRGPLEVCYYLEYPVLMTITWYIWYEVVTITNYVH